MYIPGSDLSGRCNTGSPPWETSSGKAESEWETTTQQTKLDACFTITHRNKARRVAAWYLLPGVLILPVNIVVMLLMMTSMPGCRTHKACAPLIILIVGLLRKIWPEKVMHTNRQVGFCHLPIQVAQVFRSPLATLWRMLALSRVLASTGSLRKKTVHHQPVSSGFGHCRSIV